METKFTKGEWAVGQIDETTVWLKGIYPQNTMVARSTNEHQNDAYYKKTKEEMKANAKLIAAAPEMFEVCRLLEHVKSEADLQSIKNIAKEAIKKAIE